MNITSAQYFEFKSEKISIIATIDGISKHVPIDTDNTDYAAILEWAKEDGNTIKEAD
tara:strand:+ start:293 stop:463 length:171 start_codon:yes stop_codon:yes gene_type:complete